MKNQLHAYATPEIYNNCSMMADELGLSNSAFLIMLICKTWNDRKGGELAKISKSQEAIVVEAPVPVKEVLGRSCQIPEDIIYPDVQDFESDGREFAQGDHEFEELMNKEFGKKVKPSRRRHHPKK
jgi:hypothetical protein